VLARSGSNIFPGTVPGPLEDDGKAVGGPAVASTVNYTFRMKAMKPTTETAGGTIRVVDSTTFHASKTIASALFTLKPGALRELHWHPNASEWQYYISGKGRMTVFVSAGQAHTMDYNSNDVGFVPQVACWSSCALRSSSIRLVGVNGLTRRFLAPAIRGGFVMTKRGGDFALHVGQDVSIGYSSHTDTAVRLYLQEAFTFLLLTAEAAVALAPSERAHTA
jgi:hypothetical protein